MTEGVSASRGNPPAGRSSSPRTANLAHKAWIAIRNAWGIDGELTGPGAPETWSGSCSAWRWRSCIPGSEQDHADGLAQDWAHLPVPRDRAIATDVVDAGEQLALLLDPATDAAPTVEAIVGKEQARLLGVVAKADRSPVLSSDLVIEIWSYGTQLASGVRVPMRGGRNRGRAGGI